MVILSSSYALESAIYDDAEWNTETFRQDVLDSMESFHNDLVTLPIAPELIPTIALKSSSDTTWNVRSVPLPRIKHVRRSPSNNLFTCLFLQTRHLTDYGNFPSFIINYDILPSKGFQGYKLLSIAENTFQHQDLQQQLQFIIQNGIVPALKILDLKLLSNFSPRNWEVHQMEELQHDKWNSFLQDFVDCFNFIIQTTSDNRAISIDLMWDSTIRISFHPNVASADESISYYDRAFAATMLPEDIQKEIAGLVIPRHLPEQTDVQRYVLDKYVTISYSITELF